MIAELAQHLRDQNITPVGQNIFLRTMPPRVSPAAMLVTPLDGIAIDQELPDYHNDDLQIIVRSQDPVEAETATQALSDALTMYGQEFASIKVNYIRPRHLPALYPMSDGDFYEASVNFDFNFVRL